MNYYKNGLFANPNENLMRAMATLMQQKFPIPLPRDMFTFRHRNTNINQGGVLCLVEEYFSSLSLCFLFLP
jgi:hypothetical protein